MKKVFKIITEEKKNVSIKASDEYFVFGKDLENAVKKVSDTMSKIMQIISAKLYCIVEEDKDLEKSMEE